MESFEEEESPAIKEGSGERKGSAAVYLKGLKRRGDFISRIGG